jgi:hypothetical protein
MCSFTFFDRPIEKLEELCDREVGFEALRRAVKNFAITVIIGFRRAGKNHKSYYLRFATDIY